MLLMNSYSTIVTKHLRELEGKQAMHWHCAYDLTFSADVTFRTEK